MSYQSLGDKAGFNSNHVRNAESSSSMPLGTPVCFQLNGTEDGLAVVLPASASASKCQSFFAGVVTDASGIAAGKIGNVQQFGIVRNALIKRTTRAASTDNWAASMQSIAAEAFLAIDTTDNCFVTTAGTVTIAASDAVTITYTNRPYAFMAQSVVSAASTVSTSGSNLVFTQLVKAILRGM
jgi:3-deoxy-D-arabino-heptulosonate 7-phosphate (DAHP) synthase